MSNYSAKILTSARPDTVYEALTTGIEKWWTKPDAIISKVGDVAKFTFPPQESYWTFKAIDLVPNERVFLECVEAFHIILDKPDASQTEWLGSKMVFDIAPTENGCDVTLEHVGLVPQLHCFEVCEEGWNFFYLNSLQALLDTGEGMPHRA